jgi:hypothetical protein
MKGTGLRTERDERSAAYPASRLLAIAGEVAPTHVEPKDQVYHRSAPRLDQKNRPDCHGFAVRQAANSGPIMTLSGPDATAIARLNCERDSRVHGWRLDYDNGATADSAAATMKDLGWAESYWWTSPGMAGADEAMEWICRGGTVLAATPWVESLDRPNPRTGWVEIPLGQEILSWHLWLLSGASRRLGRWRGTNSWGNDWGHLGFFRGDRDGLRNLFAMGGFGACVVERRP